MLKDDVMYLISESPGAHGIFDPPTETKRMVYCQVMSVSRYEFYRAKENGLEPQFIFRLGNRVEYRGEKICEWNGVRYRIVRTYTQDNDSIDLTVEEVTVDARST